jgi:primosomal protein N'
MTNVELRNKTFGLIKVYICKQQLNETEFDIRHSKLDIRHLVHMIAKIVPAVRLPVKAGETYDYQIPENLTPAIRPGSVVVIPFAGRKIGGIVIAVSETSTHGKPLKEIIGIANGLSPLPDYIVEFWTKLSRVFATTLPRFVYTALPTIPSRAISTSIIQNNGASPRYDIRNNGGWPRYFFANSSLDSFKIVKDAVTAANGRQVLVLVPTVDEAAAWAKALGNVCVYHSSLATGAKYNIACAASTNTVKIFIGTKIASFLPFRDLGAIVIVNAGSASHLQEDQDPRFDARVIAEALSNATGAALTAIDTIPPLGMTPMGSGARWQFANAPTPFAPIVHDLHDAAKAAKARVLICDALEAKIDETITNGGRVLVVLNRRGVSTAYVCRACGAMMNCAACGTTLTVHQDRMSCPSCERLYPLPENGCAKCGSLDLKPIGSGSKTLFDALKKRHPLAAIAHVDRDSWQTNLDAAQIVVGTTAVFASLPPIHLQFDLVADALMGAGQMKSGIWATESAARVLRTLASYLKPNGSLHIQTFDRAAPALVALADPTVFIAKELEERAAFGYPPSGGLVIVHGAGDDEESTWKQAAVLIEAVKTHLPLAKCQTPTWSQPKKFRGKFRLTALIKVPHGQNPHDLVQYLPTGFFAEVRNI